MPIKPPSREVIERACEVVKQSPSVLAAARALGMPEATLSNWIKDIGPRVYGFAVPKPESPSIKGRRYLDVADGVIYVGSDAHYWPGPASTAHRAFCKFVKREKHLRAVVLNGDAYDFPNISRFDADWFQTPDLKSELEVVEERLGEVIKASGKAPRFFTRGNHDVRYDRYLAKNAPEMRGISGMCIEDRNPLWEPCWSLWINDADPINSAVIKHRGRGGVHATSNNVLHGGRSMVTGHLHALQVRPHTNFNGTTFGVDCGCLADPWGPQFSYLEDGVRNWRAGFARLKWASGRLLMPELIRVVEPNMVEFRGELIEV